ncbi:MAG: DCC1-like thiol-disulfide oxidoreductase family protein, partial [Bacteroidota bacterium]
MIIIYDGVCHLCNSSVNFILKRDTKKIFRFSPFQSEYAKNILKENQDAANAGDTIILFMDGKILHRSDAALKILLLLGGKWKVFSVFYLLPKFL